MSQSDFPRTGNVRDITDHFPTEEIHMADHPRNRGKKYVQGETVPGDEFHGERPLDEMIGDGSTWVDPDAVNESGKGYRTIEEYRDWHIAKMCAVIVWVFVVCLAILMLAGTIPIVEWIIGL